ncbi:MAG TPA: PP2C family protein-serine/threonine phosphatase [Mycobacteriales bacterium]|jgi:hypothetical protein|nr:PP2C family protein-serine/threonine phosphatase [Mycobacteriales bacterium]
MIRLLRAPRLTVPRRLRRLAARAAELARSHPPSQRVALPALCVASLLAMLGTIRLGLRAVPPSAQVLPLLAGGLLLGRREMRWLFVVATGSVVGIYSAAPDESASPAAIVVIAASAALSWALARARDATGMGGRRGGSVLVELRTRLQQQGRLPELPRGWHAEAVVRPAGGGPFSGDFVVSALTGGDRRLEVALVDVSGKGVDAGTRALLLSGALGGLLGSRAPGDFLPAANAYLVRQDWDEGFATAVHLVIDLHTGRFVLDSAGHPPVAHLDAGSGRWSLLEAAGVVLGLLPDVAYDAVHGRLDPGDALLLYTDGLVEIPGRDLSVGIDKLLGEAERLVQGGFAGGADRLVSKVAGAAPDDRGLVLLWRSA